MMNVLAEAGAKFNTTEKSFEGLKIPFSFINQSNTISSFMNSLILTRNEEISLTQMLNYPSDVTLIYRASKDGFSSDSFHSRCDGISNTITIIKTTSNSVFGGFTSTSWSSNNDWNYDANAFIFSLRREGKPNKQRLNVTQPEYAVYSNAMYGPTFGGGYDIYVSENSNSNEYSWSNLGNSYQIPNDLNYKGDKAQRVLAGSYNWQTTEIEVYQLSPFVPYSVSLLHNGCLFSNLLLFLYSILHFIQIAVYNKNSNLVNVLIRTGVNLNIQDKYGFTPLHYGENQIDKINKK